MEFLQAAMDKSQEVIDGVGSHVALTRATSSLKDVSSPSLHI